jgi:hypothetical protein
MTCYIIRDTKWAECGSLSEYPGLSKANEFIESAMTISVSETHHPTVTL